MAPLAQRPARINREVRSINFFPERRKGRKKNFKAYNLRER